MTPPDSDARASHWDGRYRGGGPTAVSWYEAHASVSLELISALGVGPDAAVLDVGGGASPWSTTCSPAATGTSRCSTSPPSGSTPPAPGSAYAYTARDAEGRALDGGATYSRRSSSV